mgnify:CR=1 FL=1
MVVPLPEAPSRWSAQLGDHFSFQPWSTESLAMLQEDNVGDVKANISFVKEWGEKNK